MTIDEMISVLQAHKDGKTTQWKAKKYGGVWTDCHNPLFNFDTWDYRIKPEPRECWIVNELPGDIPAKFTSLGCARDFAAARTRATIWHCTEVLDD
jgi:hypothetical protein